MLKLTAAYLSDPSYENARKLVNYADKHPMAVCALTLVELGLLKHAKLVVAEAS